MEAKPRQAAGFRRQGFTAMKQRFGYGPGDGLAGMRKNVELVKTVPEAIGPDIDLMADAYIGWDVSYAIRMIRMLALVEYFPPPGVDGMPDDATLFCELFVGGPRAV